MTNHVLQEESNVIYLQCYCTTSFKIKYTRNYHRIRLALRNSMRE